MQRNIVKVDTEKCDGCGVCILCCEKGALEISGGKAFLARGFACDGLGSCIDECPQGAITSVEMECLPCDVGTIMQKIIPLGTKHIADYLKHLEKHGEYQLLEEAAAYLRAHDIPVPVKIFCSE